MARGAVEIDLAQLGFGVRCIGFALMLVGMMTKMHAGRPRFVLAIRSRRCPGKLERYKYQQQNKEKSFHGKIITYQGKAEVALPSLCCVLNRSRLRNIRKALNTTSKLAPISANTAIHNVA